MAPNIISRRLTMSWMARVLTIPALCLAAHAQNISLIVEHATERSASVKITVVRSGELDAARIVRYATRVGTAKAGEDYVAQEGTLHFAPGESEKSLTVPVIDDRVIELEGEYFDVLLHDADSGELLSEYGLVIGDDDFTDHFDARFQPNVEPCWPCAVALQRDGRVLFLTNGGIVRLHSDGSKDATFKPAASGSLFRVQADGKILVRPDSPVGRGASSRSGIVRLHPDGGLDPSFNANALVEDGILVTGMALDSSGGIIASLHDPSLNLAPRLVRLRPTGAIDPGFVVEALFSRSPERSEIHRLLIQPDGSVLMTGRFDTVNNVERLHIARILTDGMIDPGFDVGSLVFDSIQPLVLPPGGKILIGSSLRLNSDGSPDASYADPQLPGSFARRDRPEALIVQPDGSLLVGTTFGVARVKPDGTRDWSLRVLTTTLLDGETIGAGVANMALTPDGELLIAGGFTHVNGVARPGLARLRLTSSLVTPRFTSISRPGAGVARLGFTAMAGTTWVFETSPDLKVWIPLRTNAANGLVLEFEDADAVNQPRRFYRARRME